MKITRIAVILLLGILLVSAFACFPGPEATPTPTPTPTPTTTATPTPTPTKAEQLGLKLEDLPDGWQLYQQDLRYDGNQYFVHFVSEAYSSDGEIRIEKHLYNSASVYPDIDSLLHDCGDWFDPNPPSAGKLYNATKFLPFGDECLATNQGLWNYLTAIHYRNSNIYACFEYREYYYRKNVLSGEYSESICSGEKMHYLEASNVSPVDFDKILNEFMITFVIELEHEIENALAD